MSNHDPARALCDILLGAAYADDYFHERERDFVRAHLVALCGGELPRDLATRIDRFDPASFDLAASAAPFARHSNDAKRDLLELVASLHETDEEIDLAEDDYLRALARALGAEELLGGLTIEHESKPRVESWDRLRALLPPPPPR